MMRIDAWMLATSSGGHAQWHGQPAGAGGGCLWQRPTPHRLRLCQPASQPHESPHPRRLWSVAVHAPLAPRQPALAQWRAVANQLERSTMASPHGGPTLAKAKSADGHFPDVKTTSIQSQTRAIGAFTNCPCCLCFAQSLPCCQRRLNIEPPCRSKFEPGRVADF